MKIEITVKGGLTVTHCQAAPGTPGSVTPADLEALGADLMSKLREQLDALKASVDAADARIKEDFDNLKATVAAEVPTPEELAEFDALKGRVDAIDPDPNFPGGNPAVQAHPAARGTPPGTRTTKI